MREATYIPLDTEWDHSPDVAMRDGWTSEINPSSTLLLRRNLMLVSKMRRDVAIEFLYECLHIFPRNDEPHPPEAVTTMLDALSAIIGNFGIP